MNATISPAAPATRRFRKVAVLMGGPSSERDVSVESGKSVASALRAAGYEVAEVLVGRDARFELPAGVEAAFPALHGEWGEDGGAQAELERLGVPYVGCRPAAALVSFDKILTREAFARAGVPMPRGLACEPSAGGTAFDPPMPLPLVVKPPRQGSSVGVSIVRDASQWPGAVEEALKYGPDVLVEEFIPGREWTVPLLGAGEPLPVIEIRPKTGWYDFGAKYSDDAGTEYVFPEESPDPAERALCERARAVAVAAYRAVGGRDLGRIDMRVAPDGGVFALENNAIPGCTSHSLLPKSAAHAGIPFPELCARLVEGAS